VKTRAKLKLGGRCARPKCRWLNQDGTFGCTDLRALVLHHKDGSEARREGKDSLMQNVYEVLHGSVRFEFLCATCHEIDKKETLRAQGARQHKQPARVRRSQQKTWRTSTARKGLKIGNLKPYQRISRPKSFRCSLLEPISVARVENLPRPAIRARLPGPREPWRMLGDLRPPRSGGFLLSVRSVNRSTRRPTPSPCRKTPRPDPV